MLLFILDVLKSSSDASPFDQKYAVDCGIEKLSMPVITLSVLDDCFIDVFHICLKNCHCVVSKKSSGLLMNQSSKMTLKALTEGYTKILSGYGVGE